VDTVVLYRKTKKEREKKNLLLICLLEHNQQAQMHLIPFISHPPYSIPSLSHSRITLCGSCVRCAAVCVG
jgi:hypothetical protein